MSVPPIPAAPREERWPGSGKVRREVGVRPGHDGAVDPMPADRFEQLVADALNGLPGELGAAMENVAVVVDDTSPPGPLLGLYQGVPLTRRGNHYSASVPDRITIYLATICEVSRSPQEVVDLVRKTVIHEAAHHFGIDDQRLEDLGWA